MFFPNAFISSELKNAVQRAQQPQQPQMQQPQMQQPQQPQVPAYTGGGGWEGHLVGQALQHMQQPQQPQMQQPQAPAYNGGGWEGHLVGQALQRMQQPQMQQPQMQQPSGMHNALFMRLMQARGINPYQYNPQPQQSPQFDMRNFRVPYFGGGGFF
jgi:hypothetical protein